MPDNSTQDWTDDAAFWDEAWADMDRRLDGNDRKGAAWWRWLLPLLLLAGGAAWFGWSQYRAPATANTTTETKADNTLRPLAQSGQTELPVAVPPQTEAASPQQQAAIPAATTPAAPLPRSRKTSVAPVRQAQGPPAAAPAPPAAEKPIALSTAAPTPPENSAATTVSVPQDIATAMTIIPSVYLTHVPYAGHLPSVTLHDQVSPATTASAPSLVTPRKVAYGLAAGSTLSPGMGRPGFLLGGYATFRPRRRVDLSVGLRYRHDELKIGTDDGDTDNFDLAGAPVTGDTNGFELVVTSQTVDDRRLDRLTLGGLELTGGASLRVGKRLRVGGSLGLEYLLTARGLSGLNFTDTGLRASYVTSTPLFSFAADDLAEAFNANNLASNEVSRGLSGAAGSTINRWLLRAEMNVDYRIGNRFALTVGYSRLLTPVYDGELLRARRSQVSAGVKFRLR